MLAFPAAVEAAQPHFFSKLLFDVHEKPKLMTLEASLSAPHWQEIGGGV